MYKTKIIKFNFILDILDELMIRDKSAGGIVLNPQKEIVLVNNKGKSWTYPKGHIESGENALKAAKREIHEETGIRNLQLIKKLGSYERSKLKRDNINYYTKIKKISMFLFKTNQINLNPVDPNNPLALWVQKENVYDLLTYDEDKAFFLTVKSVI